MDRCGPIDLSGRTEDRGLLRNRPGKSIIRSLHPGLISPVPCPQVSLSPSPKYKVPQSIFNLRYN